MKPHLQPVNPQAEDSTIRTRGIVSSALYPRLLGNSWDELATSVRRMHLEDGAAFRGVGSFRIRYGNGRLGRLLVRLLRLPSATEAANTRLVITPLGQGERWERNFDDQSLVSRQWEARSGRLLEQIKLLELEFRLEVRAGALLYRQVGAALRLGPLRVPLPRRIAPHVEAREEPDDANRIHVVVAVTLARAGLLIAYEGHLERQEAPS